MPQSHRLWEPWVLSSTPSRLLKWARRIRRRLAGTHWSSGQNDPLSRERLDSKETFSLCIYPASSKQSFQLNLERIRFHIKPSTEQHHSAEYNKGCTRASLWSLQLSTPANKRQRLDIKMLTQEPNPPKFLTSWLAGKPMKHEH